MAKQGRVTLADAVIILCFALLAFAHHLGRWGGAIPFVFLEEDDAANIASFAAALDHPEFFGGDEVLGDQRNFRMYATIHIPIIRLLARVIGDYGTAFISLLGIHVFIQVLGFYILGCVIFKNRYWATLLAVVTLMPVKLNLGEWWGIFRDPLPRFSFQALLPYLCAAAFYWRSTPTVWPWLLGAAGALIYVHPVSAPTWGLAIWAGIWAFHPTSWSFTKRLGYMLFLGIIFLAVASPFVLHYLQSHTHGTPRDASYTQIYQIMTFRLPDGLLEIPTALKNFISPPSSPRLPGFLRRLFDQDNPFPPSLYHVIWLFYWAWAAVGAALVLWLGHEHRKSVSLIALWFGAILFAAVGIPWTEQTISRAYSFIPVEVDLIRGIRYLVPIMLLFCLWPLAVITTRLPGKVWLTRSTVHVLGVLLVAVWIIWHWPREIAAQVIQCWGKGNFVCMDKGLPKVVEALSAVRRETPPGSKILPTAYPLGIRYYAYRPVVYAFKDGGILAYTNHSKLLEWYSASNKVSVIGTARMSGISLNKNSGDALKYLIAFAEELKAEFLFVDFPIDSHDISMFDLKLTWSNKAFSLLELKTAG